MDELEQLDIITIEDKYNLPEAEILDRVTDIVTERASLNGWQVSSIKKVNSPIKSGEYLRYEYGVYGKVVNITKDPDSRDKTEESTSDGFAAQRNAHLDL